MAEEKRTHVVGLTVKHQLTLRLLLYNMCSSFLKKQLIDLKHKPETDVLALKIALTQKAFEDYNTMVDLLANGENAMKSKPKMLKIHPKFMRHLVLAVNGFDQNECELSGRDIRFVLDNFDGLADIVDQSALFTYTDLEIDKILKINQGKP